MVEDILLVLVVSVEVEEAGLQERLQQLEQSILVAGVVVIKKMYLAQLQSEAVRVLLY